MSGDVYISFKADTGPLEAAFSIARAEVRGLQSELNRTGVEMRGATGAAAEELSQHLKEVAAALSQAKGQFAEVNAELKAHKAAAEEAGLSLKSLGEYAKRALELAGIAFSAEAIKEWITSTDEAAEHIERLSHQLGASTTEVQELGGVAKLTGTDFDQMVLSLERSTLTLAKAERATSPAAAALKAFGINIDEFLRLPILERLEVLADANAKFADGAGKTAADLAILGRAGAELIPVLDHGRAGMRELEQATKNSGAVMSRDMVEALAKANEQTKTFDLAIGGLSNQMRVQLIPATDALIPRLTTLVEKFTEASKAANDMNVAIPEALKQGRLSLGDLPFTKPTFGAPELLEQGSRHCAGGGPCSHRPSEAASAVQRYSGRRQGGRRGRG